MDDLLGPIFDAAHVDWPGHIETVTAFWMEQLFGTQGLRTATRCARTSRSRGGSRSAPSTSNGGSRSSPRPSTSCTRDRSPSSRRHAPRRWRVRSRRLLDGASAPGDRAGRGRTAPGRVTPHAMTRLADLVATSATAHRDVVAQGQGRRARRPAPRARSRRDRRRGRVAHRRAPPGPHRRRVGPGVHADRHARRRRRCRSATSTTRSTGSRRAPGPARRRRRAEIIDELGTRPHRRRGRVRPARC